MYVNTMYPKAALFFPIIRDHRDAVYDVEIIWVWDDSRHLKEWLRDYNTDDEYDALLVV